MSNEQQIQVEEAMKVLQEFLQEVPDLFWDPDERAFIDLERLEWLDLLETNLGIINDFLKQQYPELGLEEVEQLTLFIPE